MFPAPSSLDLSGGELAGWKGLFIPGLQRVLAKHSMKAAGQDGLDYVERLLIQLVAMICSRPFPHTVQDLQERVQKLFPHPVEEWAIEEATKAIKHAKKKDLSLVFPTDRMHPLLKDLLLHKIDHNVTIFLAAVLEYIAADVLHLMANYVKNSRIMEFSLADIKAAVYCDKVLCDLFKLRENNFSFSQDEERLGVECLPQANSYSQVVEDLLQYERQYLRDLQMLIKVFRENLASRLEKENGQLEDVFHCIVDITEVTVTLISQVEDTIEMTEPNGVLAIGNCFLELAENAELDVYDRYTDAYDEDCRKMLEELLSREDVEKMVSTAGRGYVDAVKFYFPKLLLEPFYHCERYFEFIKVLYGLSPWEKDKSDLLQADSILTPLKAGLANLPIPKREVRPMGKGSKQVAQQKVNEMKSLVDGFGDSFGQFNFNDFFCEGELFKISSGRRSSDRYAFLFDGCIFLCKPNLKKSSNLVQVTSHHQQHHEYRLKEALYLTRVEVHDKEDTEDVKYLFEISPRDQPPILLSCRTYEEKRSWMGVLVMLTTKSMLDRFLDRILLDEEKKHPLQLPLSDKYRFAVPDSDANIVFDKDNGNPFVIKGATLLKLVERLTHHQYSDPNFVNTFLTTYRSFCSPHEFLDLLIERFNIPEPEVPDPDDIHSREMLKRFRKEYSRHVQLRVLNVIKQWVMHHFYDFERDPTLQERLEFFLESENKSGKSCIFESVRRCLKKAVESVNNDFERNLAAVKSPPAIEYHIRCPQSEWNILTFHPTELARQLSLLEFDYYRVVKPSELVGSVWTKKDKEQQSPNLLKMIKHTTAVTRWFEKTIVDAEHMDERIAVVSRILEVMIVMQELNNFNGVLAVVSAMGSASVHRLHHTFREVDKRLLRALEDAQELQNDHYKKYQERLRSINPPCVPFFGMYLTNILHIEEGNLDFLPNFTDLINFSKRRRVAEITSEIRQFQYSHYEYAVEINIREFIEKLQPFPSDMSENEISNYLYEKSLEIEPRGAKQLPKLPRRWPDLNLKSPGIKKNGRNHPGPLSLPFSSSLNSSLHSLSLASGRSFSFTPDSSHANNHSGDDQRTPKTPSSIPSTCSPQEHDANGDFSIFAPVLIGPIPGQIHSPHPVPPPVPPRPSRPRNNSLTGESSPSSARLHDDMPPPLPPRKVSPRTPNPPPRRNSSSIGQHELSPHHVNQLSPARRLSNSGPSDPPSSGNSCRGETFVFSPSRTTHQLPCSPPKLPPKNSKPIHNP